MNKTEFVKHIAQQHSCSQVEADKIINMFTSSVIDAMEQGNEISLVGFGNFGISKIAARRGHNPRTGLALDIPAYNKPRFKVGKKLKDVCNK